MAADELQSDTHLLRPEDVTADELPVAVRGYDRHAVDRRLARIADSYTLLLRQRDELREWLVDAERRAVAAGDEAKVSARQIATLAQRESTALDELASARQRLGALEQELSEARHAPAPALEPPPVVSMIPEGKAAELLLAARSASEQLRRSTREEARLVLRKARARADAVTRDAERREHAAEAQNARIAALSARADEQRRAAEDATARVAALTAQAEHERRAADEARARRAEAQREADAILEQARAEAAQALEALAGERRRVQLMLGQALEALDRDTQPADVLTDLSSRLPGGDSAGS